MERTVSTGERLSAMLAVFARPDDDTKRGISEFQPFEYAFTADGNGGGSAKVTVGISQGDYSKILKNAIAHHDFEPKDYMKAMKQDELNLSIVFKKDETGKISVDSIETESGIPVKGGYNETRLEKAVQDFPAFTLDRDLAAEQSAVEAQKKAIAEQNEKAAKKTEQQCIQGIKTAEIDNLGVADGNKFQYQMTFTSIEKAKNFMKKAGIPEGIQNNCIPVFFVEAYINTATDRVACCQEESVYVKCCDVNGKQIHPVSLVPLTEKECDALTKRSDEKYKEVLGQELPQKTGVKEAAHPKEIEALVCKTVPGYHTYQYVLSTEGTLYLQGKDSVPFKGSLKDFVHNALGEYVNDVKKVVVSNVSSISEDAFRDLPNLESVKLGKGIESIERSAFAECPNLQSFEAERSLKTIRKDAFGESPNLKAKLPRDCEAEQGAFHHDANVVIKTGMKLKETEQQEL